MELNTITLPDKPSELIRLALSDLRACEQDPNYVVNMSDWHISRGVCHVCLAGAVMAKTLQCPRTENYTPSMIGSKYLVHMTGLSEAREADVRSKLIALDRFRSGYIESAFSVMNVPMPNTISRLNFCMRSYHVSKAGFYSYMEDLVSEFQLAGV